MGKCEYVLARDRIGNTFEITQKNEACGSGLASCTSSVTFKLGGFIIELRRGGVLVNGHQVSLPVYLNGKL